MGPAGRGGGGGKAPSWAALLLAERMPASELLACGTRLSAAAEVSEAVSSPSSSAADAGMLLSLLVGLPLSLPSLPAATPELASGRTWRSCAMRRRAGEHTASGCNASVCRCCLGSECDTSRCCGQQDSQGQGTLGLGISFAAV